MSLRRPHLSSFSLSRPVFISGGVFIIIIFLLKGRKEEGDERTYLLVVSLRRPHLSPCLWGASFIKHFVTPTHAFEKAVIGPVALSWGNS